MYNSLLLIYKTTIFAILKPIIAMLRKKRGTLNPHKSSIVLHLAPILAARNILHPSAYLIKIGINNSSANKMLKGEAVQINLRQLTTLCTHLNCTPNDLFALREMQFTTPHELQKLPVLSEVPLPTISDFLAGKSLAEVRELLGN